MIITLLSVFVPHSTKSFLMPPFWTLDFLSLGRIWTLDCRALRHFAADCSSGSIAFFCHRFRDAVGNFLKSPAVQEFTKNLYALYEHALEHGFWSTLQQLIDSLDPLGEKNALRVRSSSIAKIWPMQKRPQLLERVENCQIWRFKPRFGQSIRWQGLVEVWGVTK